MKLSKRFKMLSIEMEERVSFIGLVCLILISICSKSEGSQIVNSYPLAINFDGYTPTNHIYRIKIPQNQRSTTNSNYATKTVPIQHLQQPSKGELLQGYQKRSQIIMPPRYKLIEQYSPSESALEHRVSSTSSSYQKRTLDGGFSENRTKSNNNEELDMNKDTSEQQANNSTGVTEAQRLLKLRKKMIDMQGKNVNVSIEDTNWKIAASCLTSQFGAQFIRNKDVKCASSQIVLSMSRMHRAGCKSCESYFHCEGFSNAIKRCKDNYDVQDTLNVMRECQGLTNGDIESSEASKAPAAGLDCQKNYLCAKNCMYNPVDGTCPRNNCNQDQRKDNTRLYRMYLKNRGTRPTSIAYPAESPIKERILAAQRSPSRLL